MGKAFSRRAGGSNSGGSSFDAEGFAKWYEEVVFPALRAQAKKQKNGKQRKQSTQVGVVNYIFDMGTPEGGEGFFESKLPAPDIDGGVDYSDEEIEAMQEDDQLDFRWIDEWDNDKKARVKVRRRVVPMQRAQEFGICVDFPNILVDYSKHPMAKEGAPEDLRPYRISLNGKFRGEIQKKITFEKNYKTGEVKDTNMVRKIAIAADIDDELVESDFDIGTIAQAVCNFKVTFDLTKTDDGKVFFNTSATTPSAIEDVYVDGEMIKSASKIKESALNNQYLSEFTGILLDMDMEEYTDELLAMVGSDAHGFVKRALTSKVEEISGEYKKGHEKEGQTWSFEKGFDYEGCNFQIAYDKWKAKKAKEAEAKKKDSSKGGDDEAAKKKQEAAKKAREEAARKEAEKAAQAEAEEDSQVAHEDQDDDGMDFDEDIPF